MEKIYLFGPGFIDFKPKMQFEISGKLEANRYNFEPTSRYFYFMISAVINFKNFSKLTDLKCDNKVRVMRR